MTDVNKRVSHALAKRICAKAVMYLILVLACLLVLLPFSIVVSTSLKTYADTFRIPFTYFPGYVTLEGYAHILGDGSFWNGLKNTFIVVLPGMVSGVFFSSFAAYGFAKIRFRGRGLLFTYLMFTMMIPSVIIMSPAYVLYDMLGWTDTYLPLILPHALGTVSCIFYLRQFFYGIPDELLEAAQIDGLGKVGVFFYIMLPLGKVAVIAQTILWFIGGYNEYFSALLYLNSESMFTVQLVLKQMVGSGADGHWDYIMACAVLVMIPLLLIYIFAQRFLVEGIATTGLKE